MSVKMIRRWVLVAILLWLLYFLDRGHFAQFDLAYYWFLIVVLRFASLNKQRDRIERKVDAISKGEAGETRMSQSL
jgi:hypothetical protein